MQFLQARVDEMDRRFPKEELAVMKNFSTMFDPSVWPVPSSVVGGCWRACWSEGERAKLGGRGFGCWRADEQEFWCLCAAGQVETRKYVVYGTQKLLEACTAADRLEERKDLIETKEEEQKAQKTRVAEKTKLEI